MLLFTSLPSLSSIDLPPKPPPNKNGHAAPLLAVVITMDVWEATKLVFDRVYTLDPANASKIMGHLLIQENSEKELIRLAFGPDHLLHSFITTARANLATKLVSLPSPMHDPLLTGLSWGLQRPRGGTTGSRLFAVSLALSAKRLILSAKALPRAGSRQI
ncbi:hypothetical protein HU200_030471 [Digitaria exilis]|uniref:AtC3H46-like PABC-like domain-containing protein n=1 Tax=Digitaria exilis TaxID=1010633 RepID=A0A835C388_9POAL|nr:hypothetical protein HU200_030471 [Digitaria exilis]